MTKEELAKIRQSIEADKTRKSNFRAALEARYGAASPSAPTTPQTPRKDKDYGDDDKLVPA